ncbi:RNA-binding protein [Kiritimatiellaeota bacterium B1221]|nr:RNA-binding protein [Kiritimatiellaeota bacterium B1221]
MINIYVGNLPYSMTDGELEDLFTEFGAVQSAKVIFDRDTQRSKGFGFVEMEDNEAGQNAIDQMNDQPVEGRPLRVNEARPREERGGGGGFGGGRGGGGGGFRGGDRRGGAGGGRGGDRRGGGSFR